MLICLKLSNEHLRKQSINRSSLLSFHSDLLVLKSCFIYSTGLSVNCFYCIGHFCPQKQALE